MWVANSRYVVTRHAKVGDAVEALSEDIRRECARRNLPTPQVTVDRVSGVHHVGLTGKVVLDFGTVVRGPIVLGKTRHLGGGLFSASPASAEIVSPPPNNA